MNKRLLYIIPGLCLLLVWLVFFIDVNKRFPNRKSRCAGVGESVEYNGMLFTPIKAAVYDEEGIRKAYPQYDVFKFGSKKLYYIAYEYEVKNISGQRKDYVSVHSSGIDRKYIFKNGLAPASYSEYYRLSIAPSDTGKVISILTTAVKPSKEAGIVIAFYPEEISMDFSGCFEWVEE